MKRAIPRAFVLTCLMMLVESSWAQGGPTIIECGAPAITETYCYIASDSRSWTYEANGTGTLRLVFDRGTIESSTYDHLYIYDGADATGALLFDHTTGTTNLGPPGSAVNSTATLFQSVNVTSTTGQLHMVMTSDGSVQCATSTTYDPWEWRVFCLDCTSPQATAQVVEDCDAGTFSITLDITSIGSGSTVDVIYVADAGTPVSQTGLGTGAIALGPFPQGTVVDITVAHASDPMCDIGFNDITGTGDCPILVTCGAPAIQETYCYAANDDQSWLYQANGTGTLKLIFDRGTIESSTYDHLYIYDGADATGALLFDHTTGTTNLGPPGSAINSAVNLFQSVSVTSTTGQLFMRMTSDGIVQCASSTTYDPWEWRVLCLDCQPPVATASVIEDCDANAFEIVLDIASTGDGGPVDVVYTVNGGAPVVLTGIDAGVLDLGPFPGGDSVEVTIQHGDDPLCDLPLGIITDSGDCPTMVVCGGPAIDETYCYVASDDRSWTYQASGSGTMRLVFIRGTIESNTWDHLTIYDGPDATYPVLFEHLTGATTNLGPPGSAINSTVTLFQSVDVTASSGTIHMTMTSDPSVQCATSATYDPWEWQVMCLDCVPPSATFSYALDCDQNEYSVTVDLTSIGSAGTITIENNIGLPATTATAPGVFTVGPIADGTQLQITLAHDANPLCNVVSPILTNPICPTYLCGSLPLAQTHCYGANEVSEWAYAAQGNGQVRLTFQRGTIQASASDQLVIYDGQDANAPVLWAHSNALNTNLGPVGSAVNNTLTTYATVDVVSTSGSLYMRLTSNASVNCGATTTFDPWEWSVVCEGCQAPGITYNLVPDCEHLIYKVQVVVSAVNGPNGFQVTEMTGGATSGITDPGSLNFGDFALDVPVMFEVEDLDNPGCTYYSDELVYTREECVITSCGVDNYTLCYENDEDRWFTFRADANVPVALYFFEGQMMPGDQIVIYNGLVNTGSNVIFQGNNSGNLTGVTANSANPDNALTLRIRSNSDGSCVDGAVTIPLHWDVGCGFVGIDEHPWAAFHVYPNPTNGLLTIDMGAMETNGAWVRVMDLSGRIALEQSLEGRNGPVSVLDLSGLQNGQYLLQVISPTGIGTRAIQVMR